MGRYVACGIPCRIIVRKSTYVTEERFKEGKENIKNKIGEFLDLSTYEIVDYDNCLLFEINKDFFNENIYDLLKEMCPLFDFNSFLYNLYEESYEDIDVSKDDFNKVNYPLELIYYDENYNYESDSEKTHKCYRYELKSSEEILECDSPFFTENYWMLSGGSKLSELVSQINTEYIMLWRDYDKIYGEDESTVIYLLNVFSKNYFKSKLAKDLLFYISG